MTSTPRTDEAIIAASGRWTYELKEEMQAMERELNAAKERIVHLERELDLTSTQVHELKHQSADAIEQELKAQERIRLLEQAHKQDLDDAIALAQQHLNSYHEAKDRIRLLEEWIEDLVVIGSHSGKHDFREWHGEIGWLRPGQVAYVGEKKP